MKKNQKKSASVVCFGEVLWDIFPTKTKPGGAPMNVAYHLSKFGVNSQMISRVGDDELGTRLMNLLQEWKIQANYCPLDTQHPTGQVIANVLPNNEMEYTIKQNSAWDNICWSKEQEELVKNADAFVFGSLVTRHEASRSTLYKLLEKANYKVFDINLRPPFYNKEILEYLLNKCNLLKMNESELELLSSWYLENSTDEDANVRYFQNKFGIDEVIITKGSEGAVYYSASGSFKISAYKVTVKDTVGSGDSFLAAFLAKKHQGADPYERMKYATALGGFVASHEGACPSYTMEQLDLFIQSHETEIK